MLRIEWHKHWSSSVTEAFAALPHDELMDVDVVRNLYNNGEGKTRQQIALFYGEGGQPAGVVPLCWRVSWRFIPSWHLLTQYALPYARFYVLPGYTDAALRLLNRYIACDNVIFYQLPQHLGRLRPETTWIVKLSSSYAELMQRTHYTRKDRQCRRHASGLDLIEDRYDDLPIALEHWESKWKSLGHHYTAKLKPELFVTLRTLAEQGRLKTFSLYDGPRFVSMNINIIGTATLYFFFTISLDEYRQKYPGIRGVLAAMEWACANGFAEYDMLATTESYKKNWAEPVQRGYKLVSGPFGSPAIGGMLEATGDLVNRAYYKLGWRT